MATAAGLAVVSKLLDQNLVGRAAQQGEVLQAKLLERFGQYPNVGDVRGRGLFRGVEFVADRDSKEPLDPSLGVAGRVKKAAFEAGLICYPMAGTRDGKNGDHVLLAPPFIITDDEVDELVDKLGRAVDEVLG